MSAEVQREVLEARILRERQQLSATLEELRARALAGVEIRHRVRENPSAWLAGAMLVGFWWGVRR